MKEIVDRILNGEAVEIARPDADYCLNVVQDKEKYRVIFGPNNIGGYCLRLDAKTIKEVGELLSALADELESRKKFKSGDEFYYVRQNGEIRCIIFSLSNALHYSLILSGNAFKTKAEAHDNIPAVLAKYQGLRDRGLI